MRFKVDISATLYLIAAFAFCGFIIVGSYMQMEELAVEPQAEKVVSSQKK